MKAKRNIAKLAIVGIRGLPNNYGGFETLAEYLVAHLSKEMDVTVFCSSKDMDSRLKEYKGARLRYIPITSHGLFGMIYDSISLLISIRKYDKILFLGFGGGFIMPFLRAYRQKMVLNFGGLDWKRDKWSPMAKKIIKKAEELLVKNSNQIIADNVGIQDYIFSEYGRKSTLITYGGDQAKQIKATPGVLAQYPFMSSEYAFIVTRIQEDNSIEMILNAFMTQNQLPLVMVGNWNNSTYGKRIKDKYINQNNVYLIDAIYDRNKLDMLRSNCSLYIHGHSAGGTNPSLAEAMYLSLPVFAYASGYNEHTTGNRAKYFNNEHELSQLVLNYQSIDLVSMGRQLKEIADREYRWKFIAQQYKEVFYKLS